MTIGENLRRIRTARGLSQTELSKRSKVPQPTISNIEKDQREPHASTLRKLAAAMGVELVEFFEDVETSPKVPVAPHVRMPRDEFEELRERARADGAEGTKLHAALIHEYNALVDAVERLEESDSESEALHEARELAREGRMRWTVVLYERLTPVIEADTRRGPDAPTRPRTEDLDLDEAYRVARGGLPVLAGEVR